MFRLDRDFIENVRDANAILGVVSEHTQMAPCGSQYRGLSPFNPDTSPSFFADPAKGVWSDFSGAGFDGGDVFAFVMRKENILFYEAVRLLAARAGMPMPDQNPEEAAAFAEKEAERRDVYWLFTQAADYYHKRLTPELRDELFKKDYGLTDEIIDQLQLGWADGTLRQYFEDELKISWERALKTGLFVIKSHDQVVDYYQNRLVFPYWRRGMVTYFIGRKTRLTPDELWESGKYRKLQTRNEERPHISDTVQNEYFYNEDACDKDVDLLLICEGVTDCISAMQAGFPSISPVTITFRAADQNKLIKLAKRAKKVIVCNDNEESGAGEDGALKTVMALFAAGSDARIAELPRPEGVDKVDVNSFMKDGHTPAELRAILDAAKPLPEFLLDRIPADTDAAALSKELEPVFAMMATRMPMEQESVVTAVAKKYDFAKSVIREQMNAKIKAVKDENTKKSQDKVTDSKGLTEKRFNGEVWQTENCYHISGNIWDPDRDEDSVIETISSFVLKPKMRIVVDGDEVLVADVITDSGTVHADAHFPSKAFLSTKDLLRYLRWTDTQWTGEDKNVQGVRRLHATASTPVKFGTSMLGYHDTPQGPRWIFPDLVLGPDGVCPSDDFLFMNDGATLAGRCKSVLKPPDEIQALAARVLPDLLGINDLSVVLPVLGWFFACPLKPRLMKLLGHFPFLMVWGTRGSGKTSIIQELFWPLCGIASTEPGSVTQSEFSLMRLFSSSNAVPIFLDEFRPSDMPEKRVEFLGRLLRRSYCGETEERGRADQSIVSYKLLAPVVVAGETRFEDAALADRMISVSPSRHTLDQHPEYRAAFERLRREPLSDLSAPYAAFTLRADVEAELRFATTTADWLLAGIAGGKNASIRCRDNIIVMALGVLMFQAFARMLGVSLPAIDMKPAVKAMVADLMEGDMGGKTALDKFIEACAVAAFEGDLVNGRNYSVDTSKSPPTVFLHLPSCHEIYLERCRRTGQRDLTNGVRALRRQARESHESGGYVLDIDQTATLNGGRPRVLVLDLQKAEEKLDVGYFNAVLPRLEEPREGMYAC